MYKSMLVGTDGSETASEAVRVATEIAKVFGATLHIANVYSTIDTNPTKAADMSLAYLADVEKGKEATKHGKALAAAAKKAGVTAHVHVVTGSPGERIVDLANEHNIDLIVVGNKGMRGMKRVLGSVPNYVAHHASCAVLIANTT